MGKNFDGQEVDERIWWARILMGKVKEFWDGQEFWWAVKEFDENLSPKKGLDLDDVDEQFGKCLKRGVHDDSTTKSGDEQISIKESISFSVQNIEEGSIEEL
jgi:hypothetical protein